MDQEDQMAQGLVSPAQQGVNEDEVQQPGSATSGAGTSATRQSGQQIWSDARDRVRTFQRDTDQYVRQNPTRAVFTALGIGFVMGLIFRR